MVFAPTAAAMYPDGPRTSVHPGPLGAELGGAARPTHFAGMLTVVPARHHPAGSGVLRRKDYQQLVLVRRWSRTSTSACASWACRSCANPTGWPCPSHNRVISTPHSVTGRALSAALVVARHAAGSGAGSGAGGRTRGDRRRAGRRTGLPGGARAGPGTRARAGPSGVLIAARVGATRLLDNIAVELGGPAAGGDDRDEAAGGTGCRWRSTYATPTPWSASSRVLPVSEQGGAALAIRTSEPEVTGDELALTIGGLIGDDSERLTGSVALSRCLRCCTRSVDVGSVLAVDSARSRKSNRGSAPASRCWSATQGGRGRPDRQLSVTFSQTGHGGHRGRLPDRRSSWTWCQPSGFLGGAIAPGVQVASPMRRPRRSAPRCAGGADPSRSVIGKSEWSAYGQLMFGGTAGLVDEGGRRIREIEDRSGAEDVAVIVTEPPRRCCCPNCRPPGSRSI